jgi:hypothetical protein
VTIPVFLNDRRVGKQLESAVRPIAEAPFGREAQSHAELVTAAQQRLAAIRAALDSALADIEAEYGHAVALHVKAQADDVYIGLMAQIGSLLGGTAPSE